MSQCEGIGRPEEMASVLLKFHLKLRVQSLLVISAIVIPLMTLIVYWRDFSILMNEALLNEAVTHIVLVPFLVFYVAYRKRNSVKAALALDELRSRPSFLNEVVGLALCLSAFLLYWYGSYTFYPLEYHFASLPLFAAGVILILLNFKAFTALIFPVLFLLFLIPPPSRIIYVAGALIGNWNTQAAYTLLKTFGLPATLQSTYGPPTLAINTPSGTPMLFAVDLPCSGIYSLIAFAMFATFLTYIIQGSIIKKVGLFLLGFAILQALNIFRIFMIVAVGRWLGEEIAMTMFHAAAGWLLIFSGILLLLLITEKLLHLKIAGSPNGISSCSECDTGSRSREPFCSKCGRFLKELNSKISARFWVKTAALTAGLFLVTLSIQAPVFAFAQGITFTDPNLQVSTEVFPELMGYQFKFLYRDAEYEKTAHQDASLIYAYIPLNVNVSTGTVYVDIGIADSITNLHNWEVCWIALQTAHGRPPLVSVLESKDVQMVEDPPIVAHYLAFQSPENYTQYTLYWYQKVPFKTGITVKPKYTRISLIILTENPISNSSEIEEKLLSIGRLITAKWEPLKTQSLISLGVPTIQLLLGLTILFAIAMQVTHYAKEWRRRTANLKIFEKMASQEEKLLHQALRELSQKTGETTTQNIALNFEKATGKTVKPEELKEMLNNLERHGIIRADIVNIQGQPKLVWKP
jgi:exosortase